MSLEVAAFVNDLDATNPPGGDTKSQGDDHLRLIKTALKGTFKGAIKEFQFPSSANFTANGAILKTHQNNLLTVSTAAGAVALSLPTLVANDAGWLTFIRKTTTDINAVTLTGTIDGVANLVFNQINQTVMLFWTGTAWMAVQLPSFVFPDGGAFELTSKDPGVFVGPVLNIFRDSTTPAAADTLGGVDLYGRDSAGNKVLYARIVAQIADPTDGSEDGSLLILVMVGGVVTTRLSITAAGVATTGVQSASGGFQVGANPVATPGKGQTYQVLNSGTAVTYTTPAGVTWIKVREVGGGGGSHSGGAGGNTSFNSIVANGGAPGIGGVGGAGGTGGSGTASLRIPGQVGGTGQSVAGADVSAGMGGSGGHTAYFGGGLPNPSGGAGAVSGVANTGGGASGAGGSGGGANGNGGGGGGEYAEFTIAAPAATYLYTVGAGGTAGGGGGAGGSGRIVVEEYYN